MSVESFEIFLSAERAQTASLAVHFDADRHANEISENTDTKMHREHERVPRCFNI
ncbi:BQ5605_C002g01230 [Microbotryum silenes-dioicae]|uniref:BQ5605_C002g01230 protein n=1 Tax=Microbotryum silenes-dioicae TaxID=796604 RepID=A0A2X0M2P7_9BASI|nr:BQ5605_C002g01230 [Microbotryum silenes-dioicae]